MITGLPDSTIVPSSFPTNVFPRSGPILMFILRKNEVMDSLALIKSVHKHASCRVERLAATPPWKELGSRPPIVVGI
jgi:hypothetical protein